MISNYNLKREAEHTLQGKVHKYVDEHFLSIHNKEEGAGVLALEQAVAWTEDAMLIEGCSKEVIKEQAEELAMSMLQFELFNKFLGRYNE